jgi:hypothetical protein
VEDEDDCNEALEDEDELDVTEEADELDVVSEPEIVLVMELVVTEVDEIVLLLVPVK